MSMKIGENYSGCSTEYFEKVQPKAELVKGIEDSVENNTIPVQKDEYISSEKSGNKPSGLYRMGQDENGNPKVLYDDPKKAEKRSATSKAEECTTNTDAIDREIEKLKEEEKLYRFALRLQKMQLKLEKKRLKEEKRKLQKERRAAQKEKEQERG